MIDKKERLIDYMRKQQIAGLNELKGVGFSKETIFKALAKGDIFEETKNIFRIL